MKQPREGVAPRHDKTCFPSLFASINGYGDKDLEFDMASIEEHLPPPAAGPGRPR